MSQTRVPGCSAPYRAATVDLPTPGGPLSTISRAMAARLAGRPPEFSSSSTTTWDVRPRDCPAPGPSVDDMRFLAAVLLGLYTYVIGLLTLGNNSR